MKLSLVSLASLASLVPLAAAHFKLDYPPSRGFVEDTMPQFPCGGRAQSSNRTVLSLSEGSLPVALTMGHSQTAVEILLGLGNDPGSNFNITLVPTFRLTGLGSFCLPHVPLDPKVLGTNLTDGANATLQVVTNGDPTGGLYAVCGPNHPPSDALLSDRRLAVRGHHLLQDRRVRHPHRLQEQHRRQRDPLLGRRSRPQRQRVHPRRPAAERSVRQRDLHRDDGALLDRRSRRPGDGRVGCRRRGDRGRPRRAVGLMRDIQDGKGRRASLLLLCNSPPGSYTGV